MFHASMNTVKSTASTSFVDCGEADVKLEIKEEENLDDDPLSINMEVENIEEIIKQEESQDKYSLSCEQNSDEDIANNFDFVENKIECD